MDTQTAIAELLDLAQRLGMEIRSIPMDGNGGGVCRLRNKQVLFVDTNADPEERLARIAGGLAQIEEIDNCYLLPAVRELLERFAPET